MFESCLHDCSKAVRYFCCEKKMPGQKFKNAGTHLSLNYSHKCEAIMSLGPITNEDIGEVSKIALFSFWTLLASCFQRQRESVQLEQQAWVLFALRDTDGKLEKRYLISSMTSTLVLVVIYVYKFLLVLHQYSSHTVCQFCQESEPFVFCKRLLLISIESTILTI